MKLLPGSNNDNTYCAMNKVLIYNFSGEVDAIFHLFASERLARIAAVVAQCGKQAQIVDRANFEDIINLGATFMENLGSLSFHESSDLYENVLRQEADFVLDRGADCMFMNLWHGTGFKFSIDLLALIKQRAPELQVYGVGQKVDEFKEHIFQFAGGNLDGLVAGLGYDAVARIVSGVPKDQIPNLLFETDGRKVATPKQPVDVDDYPEPIYNERVYEKVREKAPIRSITLSNQACPNRCAFCVRPAVYGRIVRKRSTSSVVQELTRLHFEDGITHFRIEDSTPPRDSLTALADAIVKSELRGRIRLSGFSRVDSNSMEDFPLLREAGFVSLFFGVESLDDETLPMLNKGITYEAISRTLKKTHDADIQTVGSFIFPIPGMTRRGMETTLGRIAELKPWLDAVLVLPAGVQPDTDWYNNPDDYGIRLAPDYIREGVIYPLKYMVPVRNWKPFPFTYGLMGKDADQVTFQDIVSVYEEFLGRVRNELKLPGMPDFHFLIADMLNRNPVEISLAIIDCMMRRDYPGMKALFTS